MKICQSPAFCQAHSFMAWGAETSVSFTGVEGVGDGGGGIPQLINRKIFISFSFPQKKQLTQLHWLQSTALIANHSVPFTNKMVLEMQSEDLASPWTNRQSAAGSELSGKRPGIASATYRISRTVGRISFPFETLVHQMAARLLSTQCKFSKSVSARGNRAFCYLTSWVPRLWYQFYSRSTENTSSDNNINNRVEPLFQDQNENHAKVVLKDKWVMSTMRDGPLLGVQLHGNHQGFRKSELERRMTFHQGLK